MGKKLYWMGNTTIGKAGLTPFLMEHLVEAGTRKKRPASRVFFFLTAFGRCCPSVSGCPWLQSRCYREACSFAMVGMV